MNCSSRGNSWRNPSGLPQECLPRIHLYDMYSILFYLILFNERLQYQVYRSVYLYKSVRRTTEENYPNEIFAMSHPGKNDKITKMIQEFFKKCIILVITQMRSEDDNQNDHLPK
jgi:hypothetical protein